MGVTNHFIFNGQSSLDYGVYIGGQGTYNAPQRDISKVSIPGRNGDLIMDNGRFLNVQVSYPIVVMDRFRDRTYAIRAWLSSPTTYARLEDTYHPDEYRMGMLTGGIQFETSAFNLTGKAVITFDCKPERFLKSGESWVDLAGTAGSGAPVTSMQNPTRFDSKPLINAVIRPTGQDGVITIGNQTITILGTTQTAESNITIDCALMDCYNGTTNLNSRVSFSGQGFPVLPPGETGVSVSGSVFVLRMKGRWWTI